MNCCLCGLEIDASDLPPDVRVSIARNGERQACVSHCGVAVVSLPLDCWFQAAFRRLLLPPTLHALAGEEKVDGVQDAVFEHVLDVRRDRIGFKSFACARALCVCVCV